MEGVFVRSDGIVGRRDLMLPQECGHYELF
jgi:hypothetical protein